MPPADDRPETFEIPESRLPQGFRDGLTDPAGPPVEPRPAATVVLLRDPGGPPEVLLVKRNRATGFVPGAWVFPGGRVDRDDGGEGVDRWHGLDGAKARARLGLPLDADPPAIAYFTAALREAFEETGVLVADAGVEGARGEAAGEVGVLALREDLLADHVSFLDVLEALDAHLDGTRIEYIAHWVTPVVEPRRYDTRFFAALVPPDARARIDEREMAAAEWLTPAGALDRHEAGTLPMIFPTIRTLEDLAAFESADALLGHFRSREIPMLMPEIVRTPSGVALRLPRR